MPLKSQDRPQPKKSWTTPELVIQGSVEKVTTQDKTDGLSDGIILLTVGEIGDPS